MKSFLQGKKTVPGEALRAPASLTASITPRCEPGSTPGQHGSPPRAAAHVEVVKEGDKVVRLIVTCVCGERVEVECLYSPGR